MVKTGYSRASGKHVENCGNNPRLVKISSWKNCARRIFQSTRRIARYRCSKVGVIGSLWSDTVPDRSFVDHRTVASTSENEGEESRALKIIYARRNNHISRLRRGSGGGDNGARKIEKRGRISAPDGHRKLVFVFICLPRKYISSARVMNRNRHAPTLSNKCFNLSRIGPYRSLDNKIWNMQEGRRCPRMTVDSRHIFCRIK